MAEMSQGEGWWLASDGRWYPPEQQPPAPQQPLPPCRGSDRRTFKGNRWLLAGAVLVAVVLAVAGPWVLLPSDDDAGPFAVDTSSELVASELVSFLGFDSEEGLTTGYDPQSGIELWQIDGGPVLGWAADGRFLLVPGGRLEQRASSDGSLLWTFDLPAGSDPVVVGNQIVFVSDDTVTSLDFGSGEPQWSWSGVDGRVFAFGGGYVLVEDEDRAIVALDASSGRERWRSDADVDLNFDVAVHPRSLRYPMFGLPAYELNEDVLVLYEDHFDDSRDAVALDASNGEEIWRIPGVDHRRVAIVDDAAALVAGEGVLVVDLDSGEERWSRQFDNGTSLIQGDTIVLAGSDGAIGLEAATGEIRWESPVSGFVLGSTGAVVVTRSEESFVGLNGSTGTVEWSVDHGGQQGIPAPDPGRVTDGLLVVLERERDESGAVTLSSLIGVDVADGRIRWTQPVG